MGLGSRWRKGRPASKTLWPTNWDVRWWLSPFGETRKRFIARVTFEGRRNLLVQALLRASEAGLTGRNRIYDSVVWQFVPFPDLHTYRECVSRGVLDPDIDYWTGTESENVYRSRVDTGIEWGPEHYVGVGDGGGEGSPGSE